VVDGVSFDMWSRDIIECIRALFGKTEFADLITVCPECHYADEMGQTRIYHDMYTGKWWWATQVNFLANIFLKYLFVCFRRSLKVESLVPLLFQS
jgi:hypothetical protein